MSGKRLVTENDIRPVEFDQAKAITVKQDLDFLLSRIDRFVKVDCPACGRQGKTMFTKNKIFYEECSACRTVFVNPRPSEDLLHEFYAQSKVYAFWNKNIFPASETARREKIFAPRVKRLLDICKKHHTKTEVLLEVGAGFGSFCEELRAASVFDEILALEMTPDLASTCRKRGFKVFEMPVEKLELPERSVDVVASFETIEHLFSPKEFILSCKRYLRPGGLLVLSAPNFYGFDILALRECSNSVDHEHLNYFNPSSLSHLLDSCGFEIIDVQTPGELDADIVRNKVLNGSVDFSNQHFLRYILTDRWGEIGSAFQKFLSDNMLSGHMWVTARV